MQKNPHLKSYAKVMNSTNLFKQNNHNPIMIIYSYYESISSDSIILK